jgi:hypothetical protein
MGVARRRTMKTLLARIALVGGLGLILVLALSGWRAQTKAKYAAAQARATADCLSYRAQPGHANVDVCRYDEFGPHAPVTVHLADAKLAEARAALSRGDTHVAIAALQVAVSDAQNADRFGSLMGTVRAAGVIDAVVDVLDAHLTELDPGARRAILSNAHLETAAAPFERERVQELWVLAHFEQLKFPDVPSNDADLVAEMEADAPAFREMDRALLLGDVAACQVAAGRLGEHSHPTFQVRACVLLSAAVNVEKRVRSAG